MHFVFWLVSLALSFNPMHQIHPTTMQSLLVHEKPSLLTLFSTFSHAFILQNPKSRPPQASLQIFFIILYPLKSLHHHHLFYFLVLILICIISLLPQYHISPHMFMVILHHISSSSLSTDPNHPNHHHSLYAHPTTWVFFLFNHFHVYSFHQGKSPSLPTWDPSTTLSFSIFIMHIFFPFIYGFIP